MERVLKRVGLSRKTPTEIKTQTLMNTEEPVKIRRRRRSKSRRRANPEGKKTRGLFNIDWESVKDCKSCKSRAITKRLCSRRSDNELYRSNSFKFERFVRGSEETSTLGKKISLCDDYSLPVDHLNKRRPNSIAVPSVSEWNTSSPYEEKIEILETYSNPRDSKQQLIQEDTDIKCFTSPDREYSQPYTSEGSSEPSSDDDFFGHPIPLVNTQAQELNSPDSIAEAILPLVNVQSPARTDIKRHPSPYYYGDLFKNKTDDSPSKYTNVKYKKRQSLEKPDVQNKNQNLDNQKAFHQSIYIKSSSIDSSNLEESSRAKSSCQLRYNKSSSLDTQSTDSRDAGNESVMPSKRLTSPGTSFTPENGLDDDMSRQRHVYETAFDCNVGKSDDDLDQMDKVSNHPVLVQLNENTQNRRKRPLPCPNLTRGDNNSLSALSETMQDMKIEPNTEEASIPSVSSLLPFIGYTPSPPSTAPLPTKFHGKDVVMNSIRSAPNLPSHPKSRLKDFRLPVKSLRGRAPASSSGSLQTQSSVFDVEFQVKNGRISEFKGRPEKVKDSLKILEIKDRPKKDVIQKRSKDTVPAKERRRRRKYFSTESFTSSSGSMESIRSSTSEGNTSTSSSGSHQSSSLSSHESDSGANSGFSAPQSSSFLLHANKLHILSPISDKSSQEPISETSDNNRNNNSQKSSPEELTVPDNTKIKRRLPQNRNLLNLRFTTREQEIQGSDSGISIQSREGIISRFGFTAELSAPSQQDFSDLPFDMPKLRRNIVQDACTSGSATSVDLRELPFEMPKLRRRLRIQQSESSVSQASSSQSVVDVERQATDFRPKLTLNLEEVGKRHRAGLSLALVGLRSNHSEHSSGSDDVIDMNLPLEKQGWFHGSITRTEAESVLRLLQEGSFLVRNSESTRQDYSLSLKSARGFLHMRIQRDENGSFILGQFSKPFNSIPEMIRHFSLNRLPIRGAEHMCLIQPVMVQLL